MDMTELLIVAAVFVAIAGAIKGFVGLGFPTAAMGLLTLTLPPRVAIAMILFPMLFSNIWQYVRAGDLLGTARRHWRFAVILAIGVNKLMQQYDPGGIVCPPPGLFGQQRHD